MKLSAMAWRVIETMIRSDGFLTASQARDKQDAVSELLGEVLIVHGHDSDGREGYLFTNKGKALRSVKPKGDDKVSNPEHRVRHVSQDDQ